MPLLFICVSSLYQKNIVYIIIEYIIYNTFVLFRVISFIYARYISFSLLYILYIMPVSQLYISHIQRSYNYTVFYPYCVVCVVVC